MNKPKVHHIKLWDDFNDRGYKIVVTWCSMRKPKDYFERTNDESLPPCKNCVAAKTKMNPGFKE